MNDLERDLRLPTWFYFEKERVQRTDTYDHTIR